MMLTGHTRTITARAHGPAKKQESVHGVGTAGQHAKQRAHEDENEKRHNTDFRFRWTRYIYYGGQFISGRRLFARPELEAK